MAIVQFYITDSSDNELSEVNENDIYVLPDDSFIEDDLEACVEACAKYYQMSDGWDDSSHLLLTLWIDDKYQGVFSVKFKLSVKKVE